MTSHPHSFSSWSWRETVKVWQHNFESHSLHVDLVHTSHHLICCKGTWTVIWIRSLLWATCSSLDSQSLATEVEVRITMALASQLNFPRLSNCTYSFLNTANTTPCTSYWPFCAVLMYFQLGREWMYMDHCEYIIAVFVNSECMYVSNINTPTSTKCTCTV